LRAEEKYFLHEFVTVSSRAKIAVETNAITAPGQFQRGSCGGIVDSCYEPFVGLWRIVARRSESRRGAAECGGGGASVDAPVASIPEDGPRPRGDDGHFSRINGPTRLALPHTFIWTHWRGYFDPLKPTYSIFGGAPYFE